MNNSPINILQIITTEIAGMTVNARDLLHFINLGLLSSESELLLTTIDEIVPEMKRNCIRSRKLTEQEAEHTFRPDLWNQNFASHLRKQSISYSKPIRIDSQSIGELSFTLAT